MTETLYEYYIDGGGDKVAFIVAKDERGALSIFAEQHPDVKEVYISRQGRVTKLPFGLHIESEALQAAVGR